MDENLLDPQYYLNRELGILHFNARVLAQVEDPNIPLFERLNYLLITSSNLDEFFEIRVANIKRKTSLGIYYSDPDHLSGEEMLSAIHKINDALVAKQYRLLEQNIIPELKKNNINFVSVNDWSPAQRQWAEDYFMQDILPLLSPTALDIAHPFPRLINKSLNFIVSLSGHDAFGRRNGLAIIHAPRCLPRLIALPKELSGEGENFIYLNHIIESNVAMTFPGMNVTGFYQFRLTRNSDLSFDDEGIDDLQQALKSEILARRYGHAVRLEIEAHCPENIASFLLQKHNLGVHDLYRISGPVNLSRFRILLKTLDRSDLRFPLFIPTLPKAIQNKKDIFSAIREHDILLFHPYESFSVVINFILQAAHDPHVRAIKATLYRTGAHSQMVRALVEAARAGKEVTAVIELRARFDEAENMELANRLQESGALVVYGVLGFKTHAKMVLVVRHEKQKLVRYAHLGTGNYHATNSKLYCDYGLLTYHNGITTDVQHVFQQLTGMSAVIPLKYLLHAPFTLQSTLMQLIETEKNHAKQGLPARIIIKINALTDRAMIVALYEAAQTGVHIDLIVRGTCCLRPGILGISENIRVRAIVGRFLEHSRIYYFLNNGEEKIYCGSADWMERNLSHRIEVAFPILDASLKARIKEESLLLYLKDNTQSWLLQNDGSYQLPSLPKKVLSCKAQEQLLAKYCQLL